MAIPGTYGDTILNPLVGYTDGLRKNYENKNWVFYDPRIEDSGIGFYMDSSYATISRFPVNPSWYSSPEIYPEDGILMIKNLLIPSRYQNDAVETTYYYLGNPTGLWYSPPPPIQVVTYAPGEGHPDVVYTQDVTDSYSIINKDDNGAFWPPVFDAMVQYTGNAGFQDFGPDVNPAQGMRFRNQTQNIGFVHCIAQGEDISLGDSELSTINGLPNPNYPGDIIYTSGPSAGEEVNLIDDRSDQRAATLEATLYIPPLGATNILISSGSEFEDYGTEYFPFDIAGFGSGSATQTERLIYNLTNPGLYLSTINYGGLTIGLQVTDPVADIYVTIPKPENNIYQIAIVSTDEEVRYYVNGSLLNKINVNAVLLSYYNRTVVDFYKRTMLMHRRRLMRLRFVLQRELRSISYLNPYIQAAYQNYIPSEYHGNADMLPAKILKYSYTPAEMYIGTSYQVQVNPEDSISILSRLGIK